MEHLLLHPFRNGIVAVRAVGMLRQVHVMEHIGNIAAVPGRRAAVEGLVQAEQVGEGAFVQGGTLCDIFNLRRAEDEIQLHQVQDVPFGPGFPEEGKQRACALSAQDLPQDFFLLRGGQGGFIPGRRGEGVELAEDAAHHQRDVGGFLPEARDAGISGIEGVGMGLAAYILSFRLESGTELQVRPGQQAVVHGFQLPDR